MNQEVFAAAAKLLEALTPLKSDCGTLCGEICCRDNGEAGSGVWLLPGECAETMEWGTVNETCMPVTRTAVKTLYCRDACERALRPFMCRIFPLTPYFSAKTGAWEVRMDRRAAALCPLFGYGKRGLDPAFVEAATRAVRLLAEDEGYRQLLEALQSEEQAFRELKL